MRTLGLLSYRLILVVALVSLFTFVALDRPILQHAYRHLEWAVGSMTSVIAIDERWSIVWDAYKRTMLLLIASVVLGSSVGILLGFISGIRPGSMISTLMSWISFVGVLTPSFLLALFVLLAFVRYISPFFGVKFVLISTSVDVTDPRRLIAPSIVLSVRPLALMAQVTIGALADVIHQDFVRTARSKGLLPRTVLLRHILRNIAYPVLNAFNSTWFYSLSSLLVVEWLFQWNGVGLRLLDAVSSGDAELAGYLIGSLGVTLVVITTIVKVIIRRVDPRADELETATA